MLAWISTIAFSVMNYSSSDREETAVHPGWRSLVRVHPNEQGMRYGSDSSKTHLFRLTQLYHFSSWGGFRRGRGMWKKNSVSSRHVQIENVQYLCIIGIIYSGTYSSSEFQKGLKCFSLPTEDQSKWKSRTSVEVFQKYEPRIKNTPRRLHYAAVI